MSANYLALLGTKGGPAIRTGSSMPTANLLVLAGQRIVVDCGLGVTRGLVDQGMALSDLSRIFITHLHSDHFLELGPLLHTAWTAGLKTPVDVFGPADLETYWTGFLASMADEIALRIDDEGRPDLRALIRMHVITPGVVLQTEELHVAAMRTEHPPLVDCYALSFRTADETGRPHIVFSGDTAPLPAMADFARGADLLVHEAMLDAALPALVARVGNGSDKLMIHLRRSHSSADEVARIARAAGVGALAINHLIPADDPEFGDADWLAAICPHWDGPLHIGRDGLRIDLPDSV